MKTIHLSTIIILIISTIVTTNVFAQNETGITSACCLIHGQDSTNILQSPLKQFKSGIDISNIVCDDRFQLIIKVQDYSPACVLPVTATKLILRGWGESLKDATLPIKNIEIIGLQNYTVGQPINVTISYTGYMSGGVYPDVEILDMNNSQVWSNCVPSHTETPMQFHYTASYNAKCGDTYPIINKTDTYTMVASLDNKRASTGFTIVKPLLLPASFMPCDTPYPQSNTGVAVLYMPVNSIGKICVRYSNPYDSPEPIGITFFDANNIRQNATGITTWNDSGNNTISKGNSTIVYWIRTGNQTGFYGLAFYCGDWNPLAVGYGNNSSMTVGDFPFLRETIPCPLEPYHVQIDSLTGIGVKHISYP